MLEIGILILYFRHVLIVTAPEDKLILVAPSTQEKVSFYIFL